MLITKMSFYDANEYDDGGMAIDWKDDMYGYGRLEFLLRDEIICIDNEGMSREFVKRVLSMVVDNATLKDEKVN
jgi:hypothetical protein